ncbi:MAG: HEAT repeat domain-containing protein, partial [Planctomycetota bacterium]
MDLDTDHTPAADLAAGPLEAPGGSSPPVEPMTGSTLLRLFAIPSVIVAAIVGSAVLVVVLFGAISTESQRSIDELVTVLETSRGERLVGGVLLPQDKEVWQVTRVAGRLANLLRAEAADTSTLSAEGRKRLHLLMRALAETEDPAAVPLLEGLVRDESAETRREALMMLGRLADVEGVRATLPAVIAAVGDPHAVVRMVACVLLGRLASPDDAEAITALQRAYVDEDREVRWNGALSLARLRDGSGASLLDDMLRRDYWEEEVRASLQQDDGRRAEYQMPAEAVERYLAASINAVSHLDREELWARVHALKSDPSPVVAGKAREVLAGRTTVSAGSDG